MLTISGYVWIKGKVGIGTVNPGARLQINAIKEQQRKKERL